MQWRVGVSAPSITVTVGEYAERVANEYGVRSPSGWVDVRALVEQLRGTVSAARGCESLEVNRDGSFTVFVPLSSSPARDNFTIAHELGPYFLHLLIPSERGGYPSRDFQCGARGRIGTQADVFALSLVMPEAEFRNACATAQGGMYAVASRFRVSFDVASVRAFRLRLL